MKKIFIVALLLSFLLCACAQNNSVPTGSTSKDPTDSTGESSVETTEKEDPSLKFIFFDQRPGLQGKSAPAGWHGDCTYVEFPDGTNMLIDSGTLYGGEYVAQQLLEMGVEHIDHFFVSHFHQDHVGGFARLIGKLSVGHIYHSNYGLENSDADLGPVYLAEMKDIPVTIVRSGDSLNFGDVRLDVLYPDKDASEHSFNDKLYIANEGTLLNLYSTVFRLSYGKFSALFTGDIHLESEEVLVNTYGSALESTLLKIPHHGHDTSTGEPLVDAVKPKLAVVMAAYEYGPYRQLLASKGTSLYTIFDNGQVYMQTDGNVLTVSCDTGTQEIPLP